MVVIKHFAASLFHISLHFHSCKVIYLHISIMFSLFVFLCCASSVYLLSLCRTASPHSGQCRSLFFSSYFYFPSNLHKKLLNVAGVLFWKTFLQRQMFPPKLPSMNTYSYFIQWKRAEQTLGRKTLLTR